MEKCFVIQPFDNGVYDQRFEDIFEPAIKKAGFEAYRIDRDPSVRIPIEEIEKGISESAFCFAEITTDNPNVWYELGYSFACNKDVVMISCIDERKGKFPFDIQHRQIITYKTGSPSYFNTLAENITKKIKAFQSNAKTVKQLNTTPVIATEGLKGHEIALLILIMENQVSSVVSTALYFLKTEMSKAGYTDIATSIATRTLEKSGMIETTMESNGWNNGDEYVVCRLTEKGENWILSNQNLLQFRKDETTEIDNLPF